MVRAYGLPTKSMTSLLPNFSALLKLTYLTISPNKYNMEFPPADSLTWYQVVDPAFARNYVSIWAGVSENEEDIYSQGVAESGINTVSGHCSVGIPKWRIRPSIQEDWLRCRDVLRTLQRNRGRN